MIKCLNLPWKWNNIDFSHIFTKKRIFLHVSHFFLLYTCKTRVPYFLCRHPLDVYASCKCNINADMCIMTRGWKEKKKKIFFWKYFIRQIFFFYYFIIWYLVCMKIEYKEKKKRRRKNSKSLYTKKKCVRDMNVDTGSSMKGIDLMEFVSLKIRNS